MGVLRLTSKKTLPLLLEALRLQRFTQTTLAERTKTSIGRVNKVINYLKDRSIIVKEEGSYVIASPNRLAEILATQQAISRSRTYFVAAEQEKVMKDLLKQGGTLCLQSALLEPERKEKQQEKEIDQVREMHLIDTPQTRALLDRLPRGELAIMLYTYDSVVEGKGRTDRVRTIIDLKTSGFSQLAERVGMDLWGTRQ